MFAVQVLVQAVVIAFCVLQQKRRGTKLAILVASVEEFLQCCGESLLYPHAFVPAVRHRCQVRIKRRAKVLDQWRKRIREVTVFAASESMPRHDHTTPEAVLTAIEARNCIAFG